MQDKSFLALSRQEQEEMLRKNVRELFDKLPYLIEINKVWLSDTFVVEARRRVAIEAQWQDDKNLVRIFDTWIEAMQEELRQRFVSASGC
ncbi:MAG TPA: hypothetical protein VF016_05200 [Nitrososphaera sp.]|jgi:hypothetical protein|nr:hypothetical protein [uncultured Nitrososphaera sp.]